MENHAKACTFTAQEVYAFTRPSYVFLMRRVWNDSIKAPLVPAIKKVPGAAPLLRHTRSFISPESSISSVSSNGHDTNRVVAQKGVTPVKEVLDLQPGEYVQVRSLDEIRSTLDEEERYRGLYFMPEMEEFCGKKFRVFKKVRSITLESNGEVRILRSPTVFLEGVYCDGKRHHECDRSCLLFWREAWLTRVEP